MKTNSLIIAFLLAFTIAFAGGENEIKKLPAAPNNMVIIEGQVTDFASGEVLPGVEVTLKNTDKKVYTDFDGNFSFESVTPGKYNVVVSYISYNKSLVEEIEVKNQKEHLTIKLKDLQ